MQSSREGHTHPPSKCKTGGAFHKNTHTHRQTQGHPHERDRLNKFTRKAAGERNGQKTNRIEHAKEMRREKQEAEI